jgi:hypothetical protein
MKYNLDVSGKNPRLVLEAESKVDFITITEIMWEKSVASGSKVTVGGTLPSPLKRTYAVHKKHKKHNFMKVCEACGRKCKGNIGLALHSCHAKETGKVKCGYCHKEFAGTRAKKIHQQACPVRKQYQEAGYSKAPKIKEAPTTDYLEVPTEKQVEVLV